MGIRRQEEARMGEIGDTEMGILIEQQAEYCEIARKRVAAVPARLDRWAEAKA